MDSGRGPRPAALCVVVLPGRTLQEIQHAKDALLAVGLMQEESDGQCRVASRRAQVRPGIAPQRAGTL